MTIKEPCLIIDREKTIANLERMIGRAKHFSSSLRPHFKTHQSDVIGTLFKERGINKITVSSVSMAKYFASKGWEDITIAFPVNIHQLDEINELSSDINLNILIDSVFSTERVIEEVKNPLGIFIKIDTGYHRSGLLGDDSDIDEIIGKISKQTNLNFIGFLTHAGHTYDSRSKQEIEDIVKKSAGILNELKSTYPEAIISFGDTPSCSLSDNLFDFDELRPGNFIYYDVMQYHIGSCKLNDIAVAVVCPVVSIYPKREEIIIYGGAIHLSKEFIAGDNNFKLYGYVSKYEQGKWEEPIGGTWLKSISQEHGVIKIPKQKISNFKVGDLVAILPIHSCLTANLLKDKSIII